MAKEAQSTHNPYKAPRATVDDPVDAARLVVPAGKWRRFFNFVIDSCAISMLTFIVLAAMVVADGEHWVDQYEALGFWQERLLDMVLVLVYYAAFECVTGLTLGKLLTGTRVVDENGRRPSTTQFLVRSLSRLIPLEALSVAYSEDGMTRGWHDSLARTYVVRRTR